MKACVFTADKMSFEVLSRSSDGAFASVELCEPTPAGARKLSGPAAADMVVFLDFDAPAAGDLILHLPAHCPVVAFGSHASKQKAPSSVQERFLMKPFTKEQVQGVMQATLLDETRVPMPVTKRGARRDLENLRTDWRRIAERVRTRRAELSRLLTATPEQLRTMLQKKVVLDENGMPQVPVEAFPIRSALIIDPDATFARMVTRYLANKCVMQAEIAADGAAAWKRLATSAYDVVILNWDVEGPSGLALYNRLRLGVETRYIPILVSSASLKTEDFRLLDEDLAVTLVERPLTEKTFSAALATVVTSSVLSRELLTELVALVREACAAGEFAAEGDEAEATLLNALKLAGDRFLQEERYAEAETAFAAAWNLGDRRLSLLTGYGKALHLTGRAAQARKVLSTADVLAPRNVERLCLLGEVDLSLRDPQRARSRFKQVLAIDDRIIKARAGVEVATAIAARGDDERLQAPSLQFASYLNLVGIDLSRAGRTAESLRYYRSAMVFVHGKVPVAKLWFNVGICYLRAGRRDEARDAFQMAYDQSGGTLTKAAKYIDASVTDDASGAAFDDDIPFEDI